MKSRVLAFLRAHNPPLLYDWLLLSISLATLLFVIVVTAEGSYGTPQHHAANSPAGQTTGG